MIDKKIVFMCIAVSMASCTNNTPASENTLVVSIEPLKYIVDGIVGDDFEVTVLVPSGASPETYEPTALQIKAAEDARLIFSTGLIDFENALLQRLPSPQRFVDLSAGIELIKNEEDTAHVDNHHHGGVDPHIWLSPRALVRMAATAYGRIHELYPDSTSYTVNYEQLSGRLAALDMEIGDRIAASTTRSFAIFHPGLTYYARDYGLRQIAIEIDGKEPSAGALADVISEARAENVHKVLYQKEFPQRLVEVAAAEIGAEPVEIDILSYDVVYNLLKITDLITGVPEATQTPIPTSTTGKTDNTALE